MTRYYQRPFKTGASKRKKAKEKGEEFKKMQGSMDIFVKKAEG